MAFYKKNKKDSMIRTIFSNTFEPSYIDSTKHFYAYVEVNGKVFVETYSCKIRKEAIAHFEELARLSGGKYDGNLHAFKN